MDLNQLARSLIDTGIRSVDPYTAVRDTLSLTDGVLSIGERKWDVKSYDRVYVAGIGKAAFPMAKAADELLKPSESYFITKPDSVKQLEHIEALTGGHPNPTREGVKASQQLIDLAERAGEDTLFIFLVSGGGSALFCAPVEEVPFEDFKRTNELLLQSGANIHEINSVRKHISRVKGGRFAQLIDPAPTISLILSDVVGDSLDVIASGPTVPDKSSFEDALAVFEKYTLKEKVPTSVLEYLSLGVEGKREETLKKELPTVHNVIIGNNLKALRAVREEAEEQGFNGIILSSQIEGEAREIGITHAGIAKEVQDSQTPVSPPAAVISGGEATVTLDREGRGGPNREFVLGAATKIEGREGILVAAVDTDGVDGVGKSGALADGDTVLRSKLDPNKTLKTHETEDFFDELGDSIALGETGTNVNDLRIMLITEASL